MQLGFVDSMATQVEQCCLVRENLGGFGLTDLAAAQCWAQLDLMMHHLRRNDQAAYID